jgi:hypothetical protein
MSSSRSATLSMAASGRRRSGTCSRRVLPLMPLRTSTVREPPSRPSAMSMSRSSPTTTSFSVGKPKCVRSSATAAREGLPTTRGRPPLTFAIAAVTIAPRLKMMPSPPA